MVSADGNLALVFNGEIYNYLEVADELESLGGSSSRAATRPSSCGFRPLGARMCPPTQRHVGFRDLRSPDQRLTLSRDRFGIKPLYYARSGDALVFASEIKGVLAALPGDPRASTAGDRASARLGRYGSRRDDPLRGRTCGSGGMQPPRQRSRPNVDDRAILRRRRARRRDVLRGA